MDGWGGGVGPPRVGARLVVAVNIEGAAVSIDGEPVGESPVAAVEVAPGNHTVSVTTANFETFNRSTAVTDAGARVNVLLAPTEDAARALAADDHARAEAFGASAPAAEHLTQKRSLRAALGGGTLLLALRVGAYARGVTSGNGRRGSLSVMLRAGAVVGLVLFVVVETRATAPLVRATMLREPGLRAGLATSALVSTCMMATLVVGPLYLSAVLGP